MTENTAPNATPETPEVKEEAVVKAPERESLPPMAGQILTLVEGRFTRISEIAATQDKVGDVGKLVSEAIETSTNPDVVKARKAIEKANEVILAAQKAAEAIVKPTLNVPSEEELAKLDEEYKSLASEINTYNGVFSMETRNVKEGLTVFDYFGALPGAKKRGANKGQGTGTSRPRVQSVEYTQNVNADAASEDWKKAEKDGKSTFSVLVSALKADSDNTVDLTAGDLHKAWTAQNGNKEWSDLPDVTTFVYQGDDKHRWMIRVTK